MAENRCFDNKILILLSNFVLVIVAIELYFLVLDRNSDNKNSVTKKEIYDDLQENKMLNRKIIFQQKEENFPAKYILVHIPEKEIFMSTLHPAASLYEDVTDYVKVKECFDNLKNILKEKKIELITVRSALKLNKTALKNLAQKALKYEIDENISFDKNTKEYKIFLNYTSNEYKQEIINKLSDDQLVDIILNNPKYILSPTKLNTFIEPKLISFNPLGNLIFCRDQQITTKKGVVIGRARSSQRAGEHLIMKQVFENLNSTILGILSKEYDENAFLEGGDYFVAKNDLSMLGVGLRTSMKGAEYLMENDLLGTRYMAIIYDDEDKDQQRMHLDTYFNILSDEYVIVLDFDEVQKFYPNKKIGRKVYLYDNEAKYPIESNNRDIPKKVGKYKLIKIYNKLYTFLEEKLKYKLIKIMHQQQIDYIINFLNIGNNEIISVNKDLKLFEKQTNTKIMFLEFRPILNMYGAMHCITQVSRID